MVLYQYSRGALIDRPYSLDEMFAYTVRFQVLVRNQEEKDLLAGYQLMYGRELRVDIWKDWSKQNDQTEVEIDGNSFVMASGNIILPVTFATFNDIDLRPYA